MKIKSASNRAKSGQRAGKELFTYHLTMERRHTFSTVHEPGFAWLRVCTNQVPVSRGASCVTMLAQTISGD